MISRRGFLKLLGLAPALPLAAKLPELKPPEPDFIPLADFFQFYGYIPNNQSWGPEEIAWRWEAFVKRGFK